MLEKTRIISKISRREGISTRKDQHDNYIRISSNARREGRYIGWTGLTQVKDRQPGNRVFQSLVGRAPRSIRGSRPNYAATRRLVHASAICRERSWGGRAYSTLDATSNQWIQMVSTRAIRNLFDPAARVQRNYSKFQRDTTDVAVPCGGG